MSKRFRKKAVEVEAVQWTGDRKAMLGWLDRVLPEGADRDKVVQHHPHGHLRIFTLGGWWICKQGDWLIREPLPDLRGRLLACCKPDIFEATYEPADQSTQPVLDLEKLRERLYEELTLHMEDRILCRVLDEVFGSVPECSGQPVLDLEGQEVQIALDPECIEAENVREFYPEAVGAATGALQAVLDPDDDARAHRDADLLASCACSEAFKALVTVAGLSDSKEKGT